MMIMMMMMMMMMMMTREGLNFHIMDRTSGI